MGTSMGLVLQKKCGNAHTKLTTFNSTSNPFLSQYLLFNEVFTFIALQTENMKKVWQRRSHPTTPLGAFISWRHLYIQ